MSDVLFKMGSEPLAPRDGEPVATESAELLGFVLAENAKTTRAIAEQGAALLEAAARLAATRRARRRSRGTGRSS